MLFKNPLLCCYCVPSSQPQCHSYVTCFLPPGTPSSPLFPLVANTIPIYPDAQARNKSYSRLFHFLCILHSYLSSGMNSHLQDFETAYWCLCFQFCLIPQNLSVFHNIVSHLSKTQITSCFATSKTTSKSYQAFHDGFLAIS